MNKLLVLFMIVLSSSCMKKDASTYSPTFSDKNFGGKKEIIFAPHPLHNPLRLQEMFGPILDILNRRNKDIHFTLEASKNYTDFNQKVAERKLDVILPNPYQTLMAKKSGYSVIGKMGDDQNFRGILLVRKDSNIKSIKDLKNKTISYPAASALAGSMMVQLYLQKHGIDVKKETTAKYVGSQESSILAVLHREVDAAATWPMTWNSYSAEKDVLKKELTVLFQTPSLINNSIMIKDGLDPKIVQEVKDVFLNLHNTEEGKAILDKIKLSKFEQATDSDYEKVQALLDEFEKTFGELPK